MTVAEFSTKYGGKVECYRFLSFDVGAYLPAYDDVTVHHLRDLAMGGRRLLKADNIKTIQIPQFEGLTIENMLQNAKNFPQVMRALPVEPREIKKLPRYYIGNIIYTLVGDPFKKWVQQKIDERS